MLECLSKAWCKEQVVELILMSGTKIGPCTIVEVRNTEGVLVVATRKDIRSGRNAQIGYVNISSIEAMFIGA